jgi:hypothetical protein
MKTNTLQKPLLWTAGILAFLLAMLAINIANPEATLLGSIGLIILAALRSLQWLTALTLGVLFCLIFLFAVFFGAVALASKKEAARMYGELLRTVGGWWQPALNWLPQCDCKNPPPVSCEERRQEVQVDDIKAIQDQLHATKDLLSSKVERLSERIDTLEEMTASMADSGQVETLRQEVRGAMDSLAGIQSAVDGMKTCVEQTAAQLSEITPEQVLGDLPERLRTLEEREQPVIDITPLEQDIAVMQQELASVRDKADKALSAAAQPAEAGPETEESAPAAQEQAAPAAGAEEHRIFSYFDDPADKVKVAEMVDAALDKNMNYKQVIDAVVKGLGPKKGKIISSHPSLTKDYIRSCRRTD